MSDCKNCQSEHENESFAMYIVQEQIKNMRLCIRVLCVIIALLIGFIFWQDFNHSQYVASWFENIAEITTETVTVTQDTEGEGVNSFVGGDNYGKPDSN